MRAAVLTPGIKEKTHLAGWEGEGADVLYLTNPLYQRSLLNGSAGRAAILADDDLSSDDEVFDALTAQAETFARSWFLQASVERDLRYRGVNLGSLYVHSLTYYLVAVLHALHLEESLLKSRGIREIDLCDDGGVWGSTVRFLAGHHRVKLRIFSKPVLPPPASKKGIKGVLKAALRMAVLLSAERPRKGGILYSCALKFAAPLLEQTEGNYYLRDEFSLKAFLLGRRGSFWHFVPKSFSAGRGEKGAAPSRLNETFARMDQCFGDGGFFNYSGHSLWPFIRGQFEAMVKKDFPLAMRRVDVFTGILRRLEPRAVVVDEDVHPFNKALVSCAKDLGVATYTLVHGVPFENIESIPVTADRVLAWGISTRERLEGWGVPSEKIREVGAAQYECFKALDPGRRRKEVLEDFKIGNNQKLIIYPIMSLCTNERPAPKYSRTACYVEILENSLNVAFGFLERCKEAELVIKFHPAEKNAWFVRDLMERCLDPETRKRARAVTHYDASRLLAASDMVLTTASTVYFESLLLRKPALLFDDPGKRYCAFMSAEYLNLKDPLSCYEKMGRSFTEEGRREILERQEQEIKRHFHLGNEGAVQNTLNVLYANA